MCFATDIPSAQAAPTPVQKAKAPDLAPLKRRNNGAGYALPGGSSMLTGESGIKNTQLNLGVSSLLGSKEDV